jgi:DNA repair protein RadC
MVKYAYRLETKRVKEPDFPYTGKNFVQPEDVAEFCLPLQESDVEKMIILHLTTKNKLIGMQVFPGTVDKAVVYPREIIKHSLLISGAAIIMVHNHPSGNHDPSPEDRLITEAVVSCARLFGIRVLDHIILGENGFFSAKSDGWI